MVVLLGSLAMICFFVGLVCLVHPIRAIRIPTRRRAAAVMGVSFVVFVLAAAMTDPEPAPREQAELPTPQTQASAEAPPTPEGEWNVHEFKVVEDEDVSFGNRLRRRINIVRAHRSHARRPHRDTHQGRQTGVAKAPLAVHHIVSAVVRIRSYRCPD